MRCDTNMQVAVLQEDIDEHYPVFLIDLQWFAAEDEGRTETPSEFKLRKAREDGQVPKSVELPSAIALFFIVISLLFFARSIFDKSMQIMSYFFQNCTSESIRPSLFNLFFQYFVSLVLPLAVVSCLTIILTYIIQFKGFVFSTKLITPNFTKISPNIFRFFKKTLFSGEGLFNFGKSLFKVFCIVLIAFIVIRLNFAYLLSLLRTDMDSAVFFLAKLSAIILILAALLFIIFGVIDFFFQKRQFMESLKMSKQEVREEYKQLEGDPKIAGQIKKRMQDILQKNAIQNVPKADVVITNPTHYAVALDYDESVMKAPRVLAKGADLMAARIKEIALEHDIPIIENKPLTRAIYANVELGEIIPPKYYTAMSVVIAKVYEINKTKPKGAKIKT